MKLWLVSWLIPPELESTYSSATHRRLLWYPILTGTWIGAENPCSSGAIHNILCISDPGYQQLRLRDAYQYHRSQIHQRAQKNKGKSRVQLGHSHALLPVSFLIQHWCPQATQLPLCRALPFLCAPPGPGICAPQLPSTSHAGCRAGAFSVGLNYFLLMDAQS